MAKRRGQTPPNANYIGDRVFPIVPKRLAFASATTTVANQVPFDLDLDFETYEVFDIYRVEFDATITFNEVLEETADSGRVFEAVQAIVEVPYTVVTAGVRPLPDVVTPLLFPVAGINQETNNVIQTHYFGMYTETEVIGAPNNTLNDAQLPTNRRLSVDLIQPWTVGGNVAAYQCWINTNEEMVSTMAGVFCIWGRKRNASKEEFYAINYRRFA
jgi:hypothetical protein